MLSSRLNKSSIAAQRERLKMRDADRAARGQGQGAPGEPSATGVELGKADAEGLAFEMKGYDGPMPGEIDAPGASVGKELW